MIQWTRTRPLKVMIWCWQFQSLFLHKLNYTPLPFTPSWARATSPLSLSSPSASILQIPSVCSMLFLQPEKHWLQNSLFCKFWNAFLPELKCIWSNNLGSVLSKLNYIISSLLFPFMNKHTTYDSWYLRYRHNLPARSVMDNNLLFQTMHV